MIGRVGRLPICFTPRGWCNSIAALSPNGSLDIILSAEYPALDTDTLMEAQEMGSAGHLEKVVMMEEIPRLRFGLVGY